jgi:hypothetical protein
LIVTATLAELQSALSEIYDLPDTPDVRDFLLTDRACLAAFGSARSTDEQLLLAEEGDTLSMALYLDAEVLRRLAEQDPRAALTHENLADYLTVAEGVSHFVYVAWNTGFDKPVTLLELELQAEVDKYVLCAWLLSAQNAGRFPGELHRAHTRGSGGGRGPREPLPDCLGLCREILPANGVAAGSQAARHDARRAHGAASLLPMGKRAKARAHRQVRVVGDPGVAATRRRGRLGRVSRRVRAST